MGGGERGVGRVFGRIFENFCRRSGRGAFELRFGICVMALLAIALLQGEDFRRVLYDFDR